MQHFGQLTQLYNINPNLIRAIENVYFTRTSSAVYLNGSIGNWFRTTIGVQQGCSLSPTLFNIFLERIMTDALKCHEGTVSIGGRTITSLRFADDIDDLAGSKEEDIKMLVEHLDRSCSAYGMEIIAEKTKLMTNNPRGISTDIKANGEGLETVKTFKYLRTVISDQSSNPEILSRIAQRPQQPCLTKLKIILAHARVRCSECNCFKNNARALLSLNLTILSSDWVQHARSVRGVHEFAKYSRNTKQL